MKLRSIIILALIITFSACKPEKTDETETKENLGNEAVINTDLLNASDSATIVADSIMYITGVKNHDPAEAYYMDEWLSGAKTEVLANLIFKAVYEGRLKAYDYITGEEMTIDEVKELEKEWKREDIGQILFTEDWYFDSSELKMYKQVNSVMLAYYRYGDDGTLLGNKSGIRVYLNNTKPMKGAKDY